VDELFFDLGAVVFVRLAHIAARETLCSARIIAVR